MELMFGKKNNAFRLTKLRDALLYTSREPKGSMVVK